MPLTIKPSSGSGSVTLAATTGTTTNDTLTLPAKTGNIITSADSGTVTQTMLSTNVAGNGPAFAAYQSAAQNLTNNTNTKIQFQTKEFDTASCYDATTNYRFTPNVAGYYNISAAIQVTSPAGILIAIWKNGAAYKTGTNTLGTAITGAQVSSLVYLNGSTDYVEIYGQIGTTQNLNTGINVTWVNGSMVRSA